MGYRYIHACITSDVRTINLLSVAIGTMILVLSMVIQGSLQSAYAVEKINTIKVSTRPIHVTLPGGQEVTVYHIFVVYTQKLQQQQKEPTDKDFVCQGFPLDPATGKIPPSSDLPLGLPSPFLLKGRCIPFESDNMDYPYRGAPYPSTTLVSGDNAKDVYRCFVKATNAFNDASIPYTLLPTSSALSGNSNSYVRAILDNCHIPGGDSRLPVPAQLVPGWSITGLP